MFSLSRRYIKGISRFLACIAPTRVRSTDWYWIEQKWKLNLQIHIFLQIIYSTSFTKYVQRESAALVCQCPFPSGNDPPYMSRNPNAKEKQEHYVSEIDAVNILRQRQNVRQFPNDIFKRIFLKENVRVSIINLLKFASKDPINHFPALVLIIGWHRPGYEPLSEPMVVSLLTHIWVTRSQWVKMVKEQNTGQWTLHKCITHTVHKQWLQ